MNFTIRKNILSFGGVLYNLDMILHNNSLYCTTIRPLSSTVWLAKGHGRRHLFVEENKGRGELPERIGKKDGDLYKFSFFFH